MLYLVTIILCSCASLMWPSNILWVTRFGGVFLWSQYNMHVLCTGLEAEVCYAIISYQQLLVLVSPRNPCLLVSLGAWWPLTDHRDCSRSVLAIVLPGMDEPRPWFLIGKSGAGQAPRLICFIQTEQKQWALSLAPFPEVLFHRHDAFDNGIASGVAYKG